MNRFSVLVRKITIPPVFAAVLLVLIYAAYPVYFGNVWQLMLGILFLAILPSLAYPMQKYIPKFKDRGREGQRSLAMIFSFVGYLLGMAASFVFSTPIELKVIYLEYLICGVVLLIVNKLFKLKASGHSCGVVGPVLLLVYFKEYVVAIIGTLLIMPVYISSIRTKSHTIKQLIGGTIIPMVVLMVITLTV